MKQLFLADLSPRDISFIARLDKTDFAETPATALLDRVAAGTLQAWRFRDGVLLTWVDDRVLWVEGMAGDNLTLHSQALFHETKELAKDLGCSKIRCIVRNKTLLKLYTMRLDYTPVGTILEATL